MTKMNIYFANDLFSEANRMYNEHVAKQIEDGAGANVNLFLPQRNDAINDKNAYADSQMIADADYEELKKSDLVIAVLDADDSGVALECGIAYEAGIPIIGLYTDVRQQGTTNQKKLDALQVIGENSFSYTNLMVVGVIKNNGVLVNNVDDVIKYVGEYWLEIQGDN